MSELRKFYGKYTITDYESAWQKKGYASLIFEHIRNNVWDDIRYEIRFQSMHRTHSYTMI